MGVYNTLLTYGMEQLGGHESNQEGNVGGQRNRGFMEKK